MGKMSAADRVFNERLRDDGVLGDISSDRLECGDGVIYNPCSDGHQFHDCNGHLSKVVAEKRGTALVHVIAINGGALALSPKSPLRTLGPTAVVLLKKIGLPRWLQLLLYIPVFMVGFLWRQDMVLLFNIWGAMVLKGMKTIVLQIHFPCGAAGLFSIEAREQYEHLVLAKRRLKRWFPDIKVPCFVHIDWEGDDLNKRTYPVSTRDLESWFYENPA